MNINELLVSGVNISEDDYDYRGTFILSHEDENSTLPSMEIDLAAFESDESILNQIKSGFDLSEPICSIKDAIMKKVMESAALSSKDVQGEDFDLEHFDSKAIST